MSGRITRTSTHWGAYDVESENGRVVALRPFAHDADPSPIGAGMAQAIHDDNRVERPMFRKDWLDKGPGAPGRGAGPYVAVPWDEALDMAAAEIDRVRNRYGNEAIYAGSYGWASASSFHHPQSQMRRFLNLIGGNTASFGTYSFAAAEVIVPHVIGMTQWMMMDAPTSLSVVAEHTDLLVLFGGMSLKNAQVESGGFGRHEFKEDMLALKAGGVEVVDFNPIKADTDDLLGATWIPTRPNSDTAIMLGLAHTLVSEGLHDEGFLAAYTVGFEKFRAYLLGETDGRPKDPDWAAGLSGVQADTIRDLARRMVAGRTMVNAAWSIQRSDHGEQPYWMVITLASLLGQIGLPGGGFAIGYGVENCVGRPPLEVPKPVLPTESNPVSTFIPVARVSDMLLNPGGTIDFNGQKITFPDVKIVYWCGGNPFHHHQDLNRLRKAWQRPDTVIVHEPWWNASARHADIVFPAATMLERNDIGRSRTDRYIFAMHQAIQPVGEARTDHAIFAGLAGRLGVGEAFTEGRTEIEWLQHLYNRLRQQMASLDYEIPEFDDLWEKGHHEIDPNPKPVILMEAFRRDPVKHPLKTPSGKIEIYSETIAGFGYDDAPGHPVWLEPAEWLGSSQAASYPLHLISNQPPARLHSQYDNGGYSLSQKVAGREPATLNPEDAAARGIEEGQIIRIYNDRGSCLAGAKISDAIMPGIVQLPTGAWFDPSDPDAEDSLETHGNPNVLTRDVGTSKLGQAPTAHTALVEVERFDGEPPPVKVFTPPAIESRG